MKVIGGEGGVKRKGWGRDTDGKGRGRKGRERGRG